MPGVSTAVRAAFGGAAPVRRLQQDVGCLEARALARREQLVDGLDALRGAVGELPGEAERVVGEVRPRALDPGGVLVRLAEDGDEHVEEYEDHQDQLVKQTRTS